ncbi:NAD(P)H-dependent oxidoreductase [Maricaulis sp.]|uniref:FMN-dependent NADH-azoreductase n=1 Tax=unclassified Maricaulis TaxID=2632371 RepID=UPI001B108819|nr:NAD(P)H-dependent oxidoreductase [Maricaulis sp.]MBO6797488.1 NAD(P)H-dependent oxidoreductase [Maricaulis sp.]
MSVTAKTILRIDASMRREGSVSRELADKVIERISEGETHVITRDLLANPPAFIDESWIGANFTDPAERTDAQAQALAASDALIAEVRAADTLVIGVPLYNFSIPGALKTWIDMIARARETFRYTENGPVGLLEGKKAYLVVTSGGVPVDSEMDFATGYMRHVMGFIGITDVTVIEAGQLNFAAEEKLAAANESIAALNAA